MSHNTSAVINESTLENLITSHFQNNLGYLHINAYKNSHLLGRDNPSEVVLIKFLSENLRLRYPDIDDEQILEIREQLTKNRNTLDPILANKKVYKLLKDGVDLNFENDDGEMISKNFRLIDWNDVESNHFLVVSQLTVCGDIYTRRPDLVVFVNGIPLVVIELKDVSKNVQDGYDHNIKDYKDTIPQLFWYNQMIIVSNGIIAKMGSTTSGWKFYRDWKKVDSEGDVRAGNWQSMIAGVLDKSRFLDIMSNFILYEKIDGSYAKIVAQNHQYWGVNTVFEKVKNGDQQLGVYWHTQGSGKSYSMAFLTEKIHRKLGGDYAVIVVTDRKDLDNQIYQNFAKVGVLPDNTKPEDYQATSCSHLKELIDAKKSVIFTLIHKFDTEDILTNKKEIIVITDEAHRTQYGQLANNMRLNLPNARFLAFTGTPLIEGEERDKTKRVFGDYVSKYSYTESVMDGATVPLYYEQRLPQLALKNTEFEEGLDKITSDLTDEETDIIWSKYGNAKKIITAESRLEQIAQDIVTHFGTRGYKGKAMVVCIDKLTAVKMYQKCQKYIQLEIQKLSQISSSNSDQKATLDYLQSIQTAVIISSEQGEVDKFRKEGIDIVSIRKAIENDSLEENFRDTTHPLSLVFVCSMWITGFDAKAVSTLYLDKPLKNHTLMQTVARTNRVYEDKLGGNIKLNGLIVDYIGIFGSLQKALSIYAGGEANLGNSDLLGEQAIYDKSRLLQEFDTLFLELKTQLNLDNNFTFDNMEATVGQYILLDAQKNQLLGKIRHLGMLYKSLMPDSNLTSYFTLFKIILKIGDALKNTKDNLEISKEQQINELMDSCIVTHNYNLQSSEIIDLSKLDIEGIVSRITTSEQNIAIEKTRSKLASKIKKMIEVNKSREKFLEKLQKIVDDYNSGKLAIEQLVELLKEFDQELTVEQNRHLQEGLTEQELAVYDIVKNSGFDTQKVQNETSFLENLKDGVKAMFGSFQIKIQQISDWKHKATGKAKAKTNIQDFMDKYGKVNDMSQDQVEEDLFQYFYEKF